MSLPIISHPELMPPGEASLATAKLGGWWHRAADAERIVCDLCPRACSLKAGDRGFCFVRENVDGQMVLSTYGRSTGFCIDPIEKKPLNHFYPGTSVLSFGTAGCNLGCKFCQNWSISKSREIERLSEEATPEQVALAAQRLGCRSVAFTYNDPVIWAEYAIDTARACRELGIKTVAVTAGYITPAARPEFFEYMDAANVDLKAFSEQFYQHLTLSHLEPVLDTLRWLRHESDVWFEITNLVIPEENDSLDEVKRMSDWCLEHLGPDVPLHFSAFHPDFRLQNRPATPPETLIACHDIARERGLNYVYTGNVHDRARQSTYCPSCRKLVIERDWYVLGEYQLQGDACAHCGHQLAGRFDAAPGHWGARRQSVRIADFAPLATPVLPIGAVKMLEPPVERMPDEHIPLPSVNADQARGILQTAAAVIVAAVMKQPVPLDGRSLAGLAEHPVFGLFVTAKRHEQLRGCCGFLGQYVTLLQALQIAAARTACEDPRFPPISPTELPYLDLDVWLLDRARPVTVQGSDRVSAVVIGRHGLQIARGEQSGLLLPGVAVEHGWDALQFLQQVCVKAGLPTDAWQAPDTRLSTFEGASIKGPFTTLGPGLDSLRLPPPLTRDELVPLARHCGTNIVQMIQGATGATYAADARDANVCGVVLTIEGVNAQQRIEVRRLGPRATLPLQATLYELAQAVAQALSQRADLAVWFEKLRLGLSVLTDVALHGNGTAVDVRGLDTRERAVFLAEGQRQALLYDPQRTAEQLVTEGVQVIGATQLAQTLIQSLAIVTTETRLSSVSLPQSTVLPQQAVLSQQVIAPSIRPAAQAGRFYPADPRALQAQLDEFWQRSAPPPRRWSACMVPHAGLIYSGRIAADVLRRIEIPRSVLIIGPKHTPRGVEVALAPYERWTIPGGEVSADRELTRALAQGIPGLVLDHAAHEQEHSIEVELPILARLAPQAKLAAIVLGNLSLADCREFAARLALILQQLPEPPLLVISSDMNHFATDAESRRLDQLALDAMERLDPEHLFDVVTRNGISMCGLRPAVIVMETLRQLGGLQHCEQVAYATSAEVSGDTSRVVGYAGTLLN